MGYWSVLSGKRTKHSSYFFLKRGRDIFKRQLKHFTPSNESLGQQPAFSKPCLFSNCLIITKQRLSLGEEGITTVSFVKLAVNFPCFLPFVKTQPFLMREITNLCTSLSAQ